MSVSTRHERREQQRKDRRRRQQRKGGPSGGGFRLKGWMIALALAGFAVLGIFALQQAGAFQPPPPPITDGVVPNPDIGTKQPDEGNTHVDPPARVTYGTNPPTSGSHYQSPSSWGIKSEPLADEIAVHNLEHGGIVISYAGLNSQEVGDLLTVVRRLQNGRFNKIILRPYPELREARIGLAAWNWLLKLDEYDETQIIQFVQAHYEGPDAPEPNVR